MNDTSPNENNFTGICIYCGKALFSKTPILSSSNRLVCSAACGEKLQNEETAIELIRTKTLKNSRLATIFLYVFGSIFMAFGLPHLFIKHFLPLGIFLMAVAIMFFYTGYLNSKRFSKKKTT